MTDEQFQTIINEIRHAKKIIEFDILLIFVSLMLLKILG